jgi:hypothetical protein
MLFRWHCHGIGRVWEAVGNKGLGNSACVTARPATLRMDGAPVDLLHRSRKFLEARQAVIYRSVQK